MTCFGVAVATATAATAAAAAAAAAAGASCPGGKHHATPLGNASFLPPDKKTVNQTVLQSGMETKHLLGAAERKKPSWADEHLSA